jgi:hypothetical protein
MVVLPLAWVALPLVESPNLLLPIPAFPSVGVVPVESSLDFDESSLGSGSFPFAGATDGVGVFTFGGAEAGAASGSSGVATGGTTTPIGADGSAMLVAGAGDGVSTLGGAGSCPGRARRAAFAPSVTAFKYMSASWF